VIGVVGGPRRQLDGYPQGLELRGRVTLEERQRRRPVRELQLLDSVFTDCTLTL